MKNKKTLWLVLFSVFITLELFLIKSSYYEFIRLGNIFNTFSFIFGIISFFIVLIILVFLREKYIDKENHKISIMNILKLISIAILFILLISLINGLISVVVYKSMYLHRNISYIKTVINIISSIIAFILSPMLIILFWNGLKEESIILSYKKHFNLKDYCKYLCLIFIASFFGFITSFLADIIKNQLFSYLFSLIIVSLFGSISIIISEKIYDSDFSIKRFHKKIISLIIISSISFECMCPTVYADEFDTTEYDEYTKSDSVEDEDESLESIDFNRQEEVTEIQPVDYNKDDVLKMPQDYYYIEEPEGELVAASEDSRTYQVSERSFITQIGGTSFVYEDENGELSLVDNNLEESGDCYENKANDYSVKLPTNITEETGIKINKDGYDIEIIPLDGDFSKPAVSDNAILYNDVFDGVDYQYTVLGDLIKEDIVLNRNIERNIFRFCIKADGFYVSLQDGAIIVTREKPNDNTDDEIVEPLYTILAPDMTDASGNISNNVELNLDDSEGLYIATITVDSDWLNDVERAYPVRIDPTINVDSDNIGLYGVEQGSPNSIIGDNRYPYVGYDDGIASLNLSIFHTMHLMTRTYVGVDYDFTQISSEAKIDSATLSLYHYTAYSKGTTNFGLYSVDSEWDKGNLTWNNQLNLEHTFIGYQLANPTEGYLNWDVRDIVNSWINGLSSNNGFVIKAEDENNMQCEVFYNKNGVYKPQLTIEWTIPDPVDVNYPLDEITVNLRPITEKDVEGKLNFDGIFADGTATPESEISYSIVPQIDGGLSSATTTSSLSYKYPDTDLFNNTFPEGTKYKDKLSNYQTGLYTGIPLDTIYKISAQAQKENDKSSVKYSDEFLVYKIKELDTFPYIARYYGVPLDTIMKDNHVHDTLVVENNTIFIRNPKTNIPYTPEEKDIDAMRAIDASLMGRGLHCEYGFEPINLNTGNFYYNTSDATIDDLNGEFGIERTYNSKAVSGSSYFGRNWSFYYDEHLSLKSDGSIAYKLGDGKILIFNPNGSGGYISPEGYNYAIERLSKIIGSGEDAYTIYTYTITDSDGIIKTFNSYGLLTSIENKGLITTLTYDDNYILDYITSPSGKIFDITSDEQGRITEIKLPNSSSLRYAYDDAGNLITYTDAVGNVIKYSYDSSHNMTAWYDGNGTRIVKNIYDDKGRVTSQTDAEGNTVTLSYSNNQTKTTDANGNVTKYTYDNLYRTTKIEYADGKSVNYTYDNNNNLASDDRYTYTYDSRGNMLTQKRKDGKNQSYTYNLENQVTSITDYDGTKIKFTYDNKDLTAITYPDGSKDIYTYNANHQVLSHTDRNENTENYTYDNAVLSSYTDFNGNKYAYAYDSMNRCITMTAPDGNVTRITYLANGEKTSEIYPDGTVKTYTLDKAYNTTIITNKAGYTSDFTYNGLGKITKATDPLGNTIEYTYDGNGNRKTEKDLNGHITEYEYDCHDRIIKATYAKGETEERTISYSYDEHGNVLTEMLDDVLVASYGYDENTDSIISVTDAIGNVTSFENDALGRPTAVIYNDGNKVYYSYNYMGKITEYTDKTGLITEYTYDATGNLVESVTNDEIKTTYTYDANGNLLSKTDTLGGLISYSYDSMNNCISYTDENEGVYEYTYDYMRNITSMKNPNGDISGYEYDKMGNVISKTAYNGAVIEYYYDAAGNIISSKDAIENVTNYSYDGKGQLLTKTDIYGYVTSMEYDAFGNIIKVTDASEEDIYLTYDNMNNLVKTELSNGDINEFKYDELGRQIEVTDAAGLKTEYTYDSMGRLLSESDNTGAKTRYEYDDYGRLSKETDTIGRSISYEYDTYSNVSGITNYDGNTTNYVYDLRGNNTEIDTKDGAKQLYEYDAVGNVTTYSIGEKTYEYEYDILNRIISETSPSGIVKEYEYDCMDNLISVTDGNSVKTSYEYDLMGNLIKSLDGNGGSYTYTYDKLGRMTSEKTPNGSTTEYIYDALNRISKIKDANGFVTELDYDIYGNLTETKSERGAVYKYEYDKHNNLIRKTDALGNTTTYDVDLAGLVKSITYPNDASYTYGYDEINRVTDIESPNGYKVSFTYDDAGNLASKEDNLDRKTTYEYDRFHHMTGVTDAEGVKETYKYDIYDNLISHTVAGGAKTTYSYDMEDRLVNIADAEGKKTSFSYDNEGNITGIEKIGGRKTTYKYDNNYNLIEEINPRGYITSYEYDPDGNVEKVTDASGQSVEYTYDALNQITGIKNVNGAVTSYNYDAHGNLSDYIDAKGNKISYTYNLNDELIKIKGENGTITTYEYDSVGNLTRQTDARGNETDYEYDAENNLIQITSADGKVERLTYDIAGNLKSLIYPDGTTIDYDYDKLNRLIEKDYTSDKESSSVMYAYDTDGNRISMDDRTGNTSYTYDILGRLSSVTDSNDKEIHYSYDEAGRLKDVTYADGSKISYEYDKNDNIIKVSSPSGDTTYIYDMLDRVIKEERPDKSTTEYIYGENGLKSITNKDEAGELLSSFAYEYDTLGYITKETASQKVIDEDGTKRLVNAIRVYEYTDSGEIKEFVETQDKETVTYTYAYDKAGNRTSLTISGGGKDETIKYEYSDTNRLISTKSNISGITTYDYDENGNLISEANGDIEKTYEYTVEQRLAAVREGGTVLLAASYDGDGNRIFTASRRVLENEISEEKKEEGYDTDETVTYKKKYNTEKDAVSDDEKTTEISVDKKEKSGNETVTDSEIKDNDEIKEDSSNAEDKEQKNLKVSNKNIFLYGFAQESILLTDSLNETEGVILSRWLSSVWDFNDTSAEDDINDNISDDKNTDEKDDAEGNKEKSESDGYKNKSDDDSDEERDRNEKLLDDAGVTEAEKATIIIPYTKSTTEYKTIETEDYSLTYYVNDITRQDAQVLMEYGSQNELKNSYIYGNERIAKIEYGTDSAITNGYYTNVYDSLYSADSTSEVMGSISNYYMYDGRGSVAQLINEQAELKASYIYDAYGNITYGSNAYESFYGYNAEETSPVTGLEYLRARYYDSEVGRFNTPDTYLGDITNPQSLNRYAYVENNPVNLIDPSGHVPIVLVVGAIAVAAGKAYGKYNDEKAKKNEQNKKQTAYELSQKSTEYINTANEIEYAKSKGINVSITSRIKNYTSLPISNEEYERQRYLDNVYKAAGLTFDIIRLSTKYRNLCQNGKKLNKNNKIADGTVKVGKGLTLIGLIPYVTGAALAEAGVATAANIPIVGGFTYGMAAGGITAFTGFSEYAIGASDIVEGITGYNPVRDSIMLGDEITYVGIKEDIDFATDIGLTYGVFGYLGNKINSRPKQPDEVAAEEYSGKTSYGNSSENVSKTNYGNVNENVSKTSYVKSSENVSKTNYGNINENVSKTNYGNVNENVSKTSYVKSSENVGKGGSGTGTVNPKDVRYMQSSIKNQTGDYTVLDNAQALKEGTLKPSDLPEIRIWKDNDGNLWTLDHRRLAAFRIAGVDEVPFRWATDEEVASQMWKMTTKTGGASIKLKLGNGKSIIIDD